MTNGGEEIMLDFDSAELEFSCPRCDFSNPITLGEARLGVPVICRGCKNTIVPDDALGDLENACRSISESVRKLKEEFERLGR
jgi:hypothetical protein